MAALQREELKGFRWERRDCIDSKEIAVILTEEIVSDEKEEG